MSAIFLPRLHSVRHLTHWSRDAVDAGLMDATPAKPICTEGDSECPQVVLASTLDTIGAW
ncbi:hypothetical protein [Rhodoligotrophos defluvii]|uniref:hypothetical protein n=1 Tax=Rhodoligotrophos defluvii TaxID=2561934 RepID=UPI0010C95AFA|nr:hypothetical protein [Rhodoligotrophos defluvii]